MKNLITLEMKKELINYLKKHKKTDLVTLYLCYVEKKFETHPILFPKEKTIYQNIDSLTKLLEEKEGLYRETHIHVQFGQPTVNEETQKIYLCPFTGKVFGDNTHPNPQDAIYDWVSTCPENTEKKEGLRVKRFFVSEDPEIIKNYISERKKPLIKVVYSSAITGKLFHSKEAVIEDFKKNHCKPMTLIEVQNQNRFEIEEHFLAFLQSQLTEEKISQFVESLAQIKEFAPYLEKWLG